MSERLSQSFDSFSQALTKLDVQPDVVIVGSGYGAAMAALRFAQAEKKVWMLERGREYALGEFPETLGDLPRHVRFQRNKDSEPRGYVEGLFDFRVGEGISALVGNGLGGGSLINANVALRADAVTLQGIGGGGFAKDISEAYKAVEDLLDISDEAATASGDGKFNALKKVVDKASAGKSAQRAPIAVTWSTAGTSVNSVGVEQNACNACGNCITGCNVGAKNTLPMNVLALLKGNSKLAEHVTIFTGVTVLAVGKGDTNNRWLVRCIATRDHQVDKPTELSLPTNNVVLAAGTFGSTEILLRSREQLQLTVSNQLGKRFSGNGDSVAFLYGGATATNALGHLSDKPQGKSPGPTINGYAQFDSHNGNGPMTLQDASVPVAMRKIFTEFLATPGALGRFAEAGDPAWFGTGKPGVGKDPLGSHESIGDHSLMMLMMGKDGADGELTFKSAIGALGTMSIKAPTAQTNEDAWQTLLSRSKAYGGFDGGHYLSNPLARIVPKSLDTYLGTEGGTGHSVTVHPLGGCAIGPNASRGVVNGYGQVYSSNDQQVHEGLYVMDGACLPAALGVNPFLTIAAMAYRNAGIASDLKENEILEKTSEEVDPKTFKYPRKLARIDSEDGDVTLTFTENLTCELTKLPQSIRGLAASKAADAQSAILRVVVLPFSVEHWLADPNKALPVTAEWLVPATQVIPIDHSKAKSLMTGAGTITLMSKNFPRDAKDEKARRIALIAQFIRHKNDRHEIDVILKELSWLEKGELRLALFLKQFRIPATIIERKLRGDFPDLNRAVNALLERREFKYDLKFPSAAANTITLSGTKSLQYGIETNTELNYQYERNPWTQWFTLPATVRAAGQTHEVRFEVDVDYLTKYGAPQVVSSPGLPHSVVALARMGLLYARGLLRTHILSFPAMRESARSFDDELTNRRHKLFTGGGNEGQTQVLQVPRNRNDAESISITLTQVKKSNAKKPVLLLIHGLAHGSEVFVTPSTGSDYTNTMAHRLSEDYDVWLLDHRLSTVLGNVGGEATTKVARDPSTMDQIAEFDIPAAVSYLYQLNKNEINVFAHCVGAGAFEMAVLSGKLTVDGKSMVRAAAIHAVTPWIVGSTANRVRANFASLLFTFLADRGFNPLPQKNPERWEKLADRLAASFPWKAADLDIHFKASDSDFGRDICDRMTLYYGQEWMHTNLFSGNEGTHSVLHELVGYGNLEVFRQINFIIQRGRMTDRKGQLETYLTEENIKQHWTFPTFFGHGSENKVFDPLSSLRSAARLKRVQEWASGLNGTSGPSGTWSRNVRWKEFPGVGHMDYLFGRPNAPIVNELGEFFAEPYLVDKDNANAKEIDSQVKKRDPEIEPPMRPKCGPIIRNAKLDGNEVVLTIWIEPEAFTTTAPQGVLVTSSLGDLRLFSKEDMLLIQEPTPSTRDTDYAFGRYWTFQLRFPASNLPSSLALQVYYPGSRIDNVAQSTGSTGSNMKPIKPGSATFHGINKNKAVSPALESINLPIKLNKSQLFPDLPKGLKVGALGDTTDALKQISNPLVAVESLSANAEPTSAGIVELKHPWLRRVTDSGRTSYSFLVGSCRHPGTPFERHQADGIFRAMLSEVAGGATAAARHGVDHVFFVGDMIYADATADIFDTNEPEERFTARYREAFGARGSVTGTNLAQLLASVPSTMVPDDHEFQDNWSGPPTALSGVAKAAALAYEGTPALAVHDRFWGALDANPFPTFQLDTRTERELRTASNFGTAQMLSSTQQEAFEAWLSATTKSDTLKDLPKIVVSATPIGPITDEELTAIKANPVAAVASDGWVGYPATLDWLIELLAKYKPTRLVVLTGDYHLSCTANLTVGNVTITQIMGSGLFAPFPGANARAQSFTWGGNVTIRGALSCNATPLSNATQQFVRVDIEKKIESGYPLHVRAINARGEVLETALLNLS
jgi:cholesterol oxidase